MSAPVRIAPPANLEAPQAVPPATGLVALALTPDMTDPRWQLGYEYTPELPAGYARNRSTISQTLGTNIGPGVDAANIEVIPVYLTVEDHASTFVVRAQDYVTRATRLLETYTTKLLEREFWTGEIAGEDDLPNPRLSSPGAINVTPAGGPVAPQKAVARLMGALGDAGMGDGMVHVPKRIGIQLPDGWRNASTYEDYGFVVVAGTGYPGTGPDGTGDNWAYATAMVNVRLGPIEILPETFADAVNTRDNSVTYYAQRVGAADFAGPVFACRVNES